MSQEAKGLLMVTWLVNEKNNSIQDFVVPGLTSIPFHDILRCS